jgi:predicted RNA methylase
MEVRKNAHERILFDAANSNPNKFYHLILHFERYVYAMKHIYNKTVVDAACGACYGSWLISLGAKKIIMIDYDQQAFEYSKKFNYISDHKFLLANLEKSKLPKADMYISFETIEHLNDPAKFLKRIPANQLLYSIPLHVNSIFHKTNFNSFEDIINLMEDSGWTIKSYHKQILKLLKKNRYFYYGRAQR